MLLDPVFLRGAVATLRTDVRRPTSEVLRDKALLVKGWRHLLRLLDFRAESKGRVPPKDAYVFVALGHLVDRVWQLQIGVALRDGIALRFARKAELLATVPFGRASRHASVA